LSTPQKIIIFGAGGHATSVANVAESAGYEVIAFVDKDKTGETLLDRPVFNECAAIEGWQDLFLAIAIGDNFTRERVYRDLQLRCSPQRFPVLVHRSATISKHAKIDFGTVVMPGALVGPNCIVGKFCLLNTRASIDHDTTMLDFSSLAPGAIAGGRVSIGLRSSIAISATVINGISIGNDTIIGASSLLNSNLPNNVVAYGNPAKIIRQRKNDTPYLK
jgi:sugar O-acyltransferase (sialic acid O-acetyltransferase NeuD family)